MFISRRILVVFAGALAIAACGGPQPGGDPISTVQALYQPYLENRPASDHLSAAPWTQEMRDLLRQARERREASGVAVLDFDPVIDGQDWEIDAVAVTMPAAPADGRAEVQARFHNFGAETVVIYDMVEQGGGWRVDNIRTANWSLRELLADEGIAVGAE